MNAVFVESLAYITPIEIRDANREEREQRRRLINSIDVVKPLDGPKIHAVLVRVVVFKRPNGSVKTEVSYCNRLNSTRHIGENEMSGSAPAPRH